MTNVVLRNECILIEGSSTYYAETHHIQSKYQQLWYKLFQLIPAMVTAVIVTLTVGQVVPRWVGIVGLVTAVVTATGTALNPQQSYTEHVTAARAFKVMKDEACAILEFSELSTSEELTISVKSLQDRYKDLVRTAPVIKYWAFVRARTRIEAGAHGHHEES
jgi:hypothetical protein